MIVWFNGSEEPSRLGLKEVQVSCQHRRARLPCVRCLVALSRRCFAQSTEAPALRRGRLTFGLHGASTEKAFCMSSSACALDRQLPCRLKPLRERERTSFPIVKNDEHKCGGRGTSGKTTKGPLQGKDGS